MSLLFQPTSNIRKDEQDLVYKTKREKYKAVIDDIERLRLAGRPSLVGTTGRVSDKQNAEAKVSHNVNANNMQKRPRW
jgi:preprotein translocase subunit SecA